jgi:hypothetical protein
VTTLLKKRSDLMASPYRGRAPVCIILVFVPSYPSCVCIFSPFSVFVFPLSLLPIGLMRPFFELVFRVIDSSPVGLADIFCCSLTLGWPGRGFPSGLPNPSPAAMVITASSLAPFFFASVPFLSCSMLPRAFQLVFCFLVVLSGRLFSSSRFMFFCALRYFHAALIPRCLVLVRQFCRVFVCYICSVFCGLVFRPPVLVLYPLDPIQSFVPYVFFCLPLSATRAVCSNHLYIIFVGAPRT